MFSLTISFGPAATMWTLMWRDKEKAEAAWNAVALAKASETVLNLTDEFGQEAVIEIATVHGVMLEDMEQSKLAHIERAMHQQRMQVKAQEMAQSDPVLRAARFQQGPAVLTPGMPGMPGMNGGFRG